MMKILVVGNCQSEGLASSLSTLLPNSQVQSLHLRPASFGSFRELIAEYSGIGVKLIVNYQFRNNNEVLDALNEISVEPLIFVPHITFYAFHPDTIFAFANDKEVLNPQGSTWNSRICLLSYLAGETVDSTVQRFCEREYADLGYFEHWESSCRALDAVFQYCDLDFRRWLRSVQRAGVFMHGINHPTKFAIQHLAAQIAEKLKHEARSIPDIGRFGQDNNRSMWPVYPEIASRLGFDGSYTFWHHNNSMDLDQFIHASFKLWDKSELRLQQVRMVPKLPNHAPSVLREVGK